MCTEMNGEVRTEKSTVSVNSGFKPHPPLYQLCGERLILADHDDQQSYFNVLILIELHSALKDDREEFHALLFLPLDWIGLYHRNKSLDSARCNNR